MLIGRWEVKYSQCYVLKHNNRESKAKSIKKGMTFVFGHFEIEVKVDDKDEVGHGDRT